MAELDSTQPQTGESHGSSAAVVSRRAADRLRAGYLWVYRTDVERFIGQSEGGGLVTVVDTRLLPLGTALYSSSSQISLRMVSREAGLGRERYLRDVFKRLVEALAVRTEFASQATQDDACRLIFSEADALPGIVIDRYADIAVVQLLTQGTAQADVRQVVAEALSMLPELRIAVERPDPRVRELEQLPHPPDEPLFLRDGHVAQATIFTINGLRFHFDAAAGQKTGAFLDQRLNYAAAAKYARGEALDVCTYQVWLPELSDSDTGIE